MIRPATLDDIIDIEEVYRVARLFMARNGNPSQWKDGYPQRQIIESDICNGTLYVVEHKAQIEAVFALIDGEDPTYGYIDGEWLDDGEYSAVHRIASRGRMKGAGRLCLEFAERKSRSIRIDTHADNLPMQHVLETRGYTRTGIIYLQNGEERIAYQKINR